MKKIIIFGFFILLSLSSCKSKVATTTTSLPSQQLPIIDTSSDFTLAGTADGLFYIKNNLFKKVFNLPIKKLLQTSYGYFLLTDDGIFFTDDFITFSPTNNGIKSLYLKNLDVSNDVTYTERSPNLIDIKICPNDDELLITADKNKIYYSVDKGKLWTPVGGPSTVSGHKALAIVREKNLIRLFVSHAYKGIYTRLTTEKRWTKLSDGLNVQNNSSINIAYNEISDILITPTDSDKFDIFCATNFSPKIYKLDKNKWSLIYQNVATKPDKQFNIIEDLQLSGATFSYSTLSGRMQLTNNDETADKNVANQIKVLTNLNINNINCLFDAQNNKCYNILNHKKSVNSVATDKRGIYLPNEIIKSQEKLEHFVQYMKKANLNTIVIDIKDDDGNICYQTHNKMLQNIVHYDTTIDLPNLVEIAKQNDIYLVGRIVLFKDKNLFNYDNYKYTIKDKTKINNVNEKDKSWHGYYLKKNRKKTPDNDEPEFVKRYYNEYWCDPYCTDVWLYNVTIANEIIDYGINEIQFDYIRFPTDGENIGDCYYSFKDETHDSSESIILSFLRYCRSKINVPISIDVYGANGYYRTGGSTNQDVNTFAKYVDVICPMFYPSHFEDDFLSEPPENMRTYRIYYQGTLRCNQIADNRVIIRPYIQAFKLFTDYDKKYFGHEYITNQINGVKDSLNEGFVFWDMIDDYKYIEFLAEGKK